MNRLKSWILMAGAVAVLSFPLAHAYAQCSAPSEGLVGHWKLDETTTTNPVDSSGYGNNGTLVGGLDPASDSVSGVLGTALDFDGVDDQIQIADPGADSIFDIDAGESVTLSAWVYPTTLVNEYTLIVNKGSAGGGDANYGLQPNYKKLTFFYRNAGDTAWVEYQTDNDVIEVGGWYHVVSTITIGTPGSAKIFVNGEEVPASWTVGTGTDAPLVNNGPVKIGELNVNEEFVGYIDDVRIYNRYFSAEEVAALYSTRSAGDVQAGYMAYDAKSAAMVYCDGTDWVHMGVGSYNPNGVAAAGVAYLERTTALDGVVDGGKVTGSFWAKFDSSLGGQQIFQMSQSDFLIQFNAGDNFYIGGNDSGNNYAQRMQSSTTITDGQWHHYLFSMDSTDYGSGRLYIDGVDDLGFYPAGDTQNNITFTTPNFNVLSNNTGSNPTQAEVADFWLDFNTYVDFSDPAERRKFISDKGMPMYLGQDGSIPLGSPPDLFFSGDSANWGTNRGTGGALTLTGGTLQTASTQPGECVAEGGPFAAAGVYNTGEFVRDVWGDGEYVYVADTFGGIKAFTHDGSSFTLVDTDTTYRVHAVSGDGTYIYTAHGANDSVSAWTFDGVSFTEIDNYTTSAEAYYAYSTGGYVYVLDGDEFKALSFNGASFSLIDSYTMPQDYGAAAPNIWSDGTYLYVANGNVGGVLAFTFNGSDISLAGSVVTPNSASRVFGANGYIYVAINNEGLIAYSFDGSTFTSRGQVDPGDFGYSVWADENYVYLSRSDASIYAYTHDGSSFTLVDSQTATDFGRGVWGDGEYVYHATANDGVRAYSGFTTCSCGALPSGILAKKGHLTYDSNFNVMKYCNGAEWVAMGPTGGTPPTDQLVAHWEFDDGAGTTVTDSVGSSDGSLLSLDGPTGWQWVDGMIGGALQMAGNGSDDYIDITANAALEMGGDGAGAGDFALAIWFKQLSAGTDVLFNKRWRHAATGYYLRIESDGSLRAYINDPPDSSQQTRDSNTSGLNDGKWHHVVANFDRDGDVTFYIDGVLDSGGGAITSEQDSITDNSIDVQLGSDRNSGASSTGTMDGLIDDARIYKKLLSEREVQQLYHYGLSGGLGDVSGSCSSPSRPEGNMLYATDNNVMQYCNGENWIGIGQ